MQAQVQWTKGSDGLIVVGYPHEERRLGLRHYNCRKSKLVLVDNLTQANETLIDLAPLDHSPSYVVQTALVSATS